jgi:transketolase
MRNRFAEVFYELGKVNDKLCMVVADISPAGSIEKFRKDFPGRFINAGVAELSLIQLLLLRYFDHSNSYVMTFAIKICL